MLTAAEYRRTPVNDSVARDASFFTHSAGIISLAENFRRDPRKYRNSNVTALNGVEPTALWRQGLGALKVGTERIGHEDHLPEDVASIRHPATELITHLGTTLWIPRQVRNFSTAHFLGRELDDESFGVRTALWSHDDSFGFTPDQVELELLREQGVNVSVFEGKHNEVLFRPKYAAEVIKQATVN